MATKSCEIPGGLGIYIGLGIYHYCIGCQLAGEQTNIFLVTCNIMTYSIFVTHYGKRYISTQKQKIQLLASKESVKLVLPLSNDAIAACIIMVYVVVASIFAAYTDIYTRSICSTYVLLLNITS